MMALEATTIKMLESTTAHQAMAKVVQRDCDESLAELLILSSDYNKYCWNVLAASADIWFSNLTRIAE